MLFIFQKKKDPLRFLIQKSNLVFDTEVRYSNPSIATLRIPPSLPPCSLPCFVDKRTCHQQNSFEVRRFAPGVRVTQTLAHRRLLSALLPPRPSLSGHIASTAYIRYGNYWGILDYRLVIVWTLLWGLTGVVHLFVAKYVTEDTVGLVFNCKLVR